MFSAEQDRSSIVKLARRMAKDDPRADAALNAVARDVTRGGFKVQVPQQPSAARARQIANDLIDRLNLTQTTDDVVRETLRDGDGFYELAIDADGFIQSVTRKPTLEMRRLSDLQDRFSDPEKAFCWNDEVFMLLGLPPRDAVFFAEYQIVHARWAHDAGERYGQPLFTSGRQSWLYASEGEKDMAVRRKIRAGMRYIHNLKGASEGQIAAYRERNKDALTNPDVATADFFANADSTTIDAVQGDAHLSEIDDVEHMVATAFFNSPVPMELLGYGENLNRDVLQEKQDHYDDVLDGIAAWLDDQFLIPLLERQWMLQGIWPASLRYTIVRPSRTPITALLLQNAGTAAKGLQEAGIPDRIVYELLAQIVPGMDVDRIMELKAAEPPPMPNSGMGMGADGTRTMFQVGDRVRVRDGMEHGKGMGGEGTIAIVSTPGLGVRLDAMPETIHKWYVAAEIEPVAAAAQSQPMSMNERTNGNGHHLKETVIYAQG